MMSDIAGLLERLKHFVTAEAETQYQTLLDQWSRSLSERVARGWAIEGISFLSAKGHYIRLRCARNDSRFREGDLLILHRGNPQDTNALQVELQYDGGTELEVSLKDGNELFLQEFPTGWIADQGWFDSSSFYLSALDAVADTQRGRNIILPLLQGNLIPRLDPARYERALDRLKETELNSSQAEAVAQAYAADLLHHIQGPPGTGKTLVLAHLVKLLTEDGQRVLVTALTHRAINNALNKINKLDEGIPVCKIGTEITADDLLPENYRNFASVPTEMLKAGYVIGATPFATQSKRLAGVEFDVVLFDEASQVTLPLAIMGMLAGNKYIFIGDENQLPPISILTSAAKPPDSIFTYLAGRGNTTMLDTTYRLNDVLTDWPSSTFYEGLLYANDGNASRRLKLSSTATLWDDVIEPESPAVFVDLCHRNTTVRSQTEADVIVSLIQALRKRGLPPEEIGVVVPYRAQSRLIRSLFRRVEPDEKILGQLIVDTVERMQGQEREVVMVSFATASPVFAEQLADFLFQPQRLNVAVTRPRSKLILVGSHHLFSAEPVDREKAASFELMRSLVAACDQITIPEGHLR
ncbi:MAG: AAA family ATPase [Anaerolineae bacterium]|jgi:DNA replication ATP-dependent helicase Dna2|nr:AAA family ATPase [Anaerolineae bacterium]MBT7990870.1 AAA family ATPase [Anaerolineae bacterium]